MIQKLTQCCACLVLWNKAQNDKKMPEEKLGRYIREKKKSTDMLEKRIIQREKRTEGKRKTEEDKSFKIHKYLM